MENNNGQFYYYEEKNDSPKNGTPKKFRSGVVLFFVLGMLCVVGLCVLVSTIIVNKKIEDMQNTAENVVIYKSIDEHPDANILSKGDMSIAEIVEIAGDSVVEISTGTITTGKRFNQYVSSGAGSGIIISESGYVVTNYHVISNSSSIKVTLADGSTSNAIVRGYDELTDIAILKLSTSFEGLIPAIIGSSSNLVVGETVVAIGNPLGQLGGTVTNGIISAKEREIIVDGVKMVLLQTNAAVNPGNSGGGLFDKDGKLVGIVNAKTAESDVEGIGFAIPIDTAYPIIEDIIAEGYVQGRADTDAVSFYEIDNVLTLSRYRNVGLYVANDYDNLKANDFIYTVNSKKITTETEWRNTIMQCKVGDEVTIEVYRNGQLETIIFVVPESKPPKK